MTGLAYLRFELVRTLRNRRFFVFSLAFPIVLYFAIAGPARDVSNLSGSGISAPLYFMVGLVAFGTMNGVLGTGARIAGERAVGWNRQLRITPLSARSYFRAKVVTAYAMALLTIGVLYAAGAVLGVRLPAGSWLAMTGLILVALVPFAGLGIAFGHLLNTDTVGPVMGGSTALFSLLGGAWFPIASSGLLHDIAQALPSYWLVQAAHVGIGGAGWSGGGWLVVGLWTAGTVLLAGRAFRRDTARD